MQSKKTYLSKTLWMNLVIALSAFFPGVSEWVAGHPDLFMVGFSVINMVLRAVTKDKLELK